MSIAFYSVSLDKMSPTKPSAIKLTSPGFVPGIIT